MILKLILIVKINIGTKKMYLSYAVDNTTMPIYYLDRWIRSRFDTFMLAFTPNLKE